jgi:autotransporter-associated beta strand protein
VGGGSLTLTAVNTYTGPTTIDATGTMAISPTGSIATSGVVDNGVFDISAATSPVNIASLAGTGRVDIAGQTLSLSNASGTFTGIISGAGDFAVIGGSETLGGTNTYTGATNLGAGTLIVNGTIATSSGVSVGAGGHLAGTGTVSSTTVAGGGTLAPGSGSAPGTLGVAGDVTFLNGSTYDVTVSSGGVSRLAASGAADLAGSLVVSSTGGYTVGKTMTVLSAAGGINGTFTLANAGLSPNFTYVLSYDPDDVFLTINLAHLSPLLPVGATPNAFAAGGGIDAAIAAGDTLSPAFENLGNLSSSDLGTAANQLSGELGADLPETARVLSDPFLGTIFNRMTGYDGGSRQSRALDNRAWVNGFYSRDTLKGDPALGTSDVANNGGGLAGGVDWHPSQDLMFGGALSYGHASLRLSGGLGQASGNAFQVAGYGFMRFSPHFYGALAAIAGFDQLTTSRTLTVPATDTLNASVTAITYGGRYETGIYLGWVTPYAAVQSVVFHTPSYDETASTGDFALTYGGRNSAATRVELGIGNDGRIGFGDGMSLDIGGRVAWGHDLSADRDAAVSFTQLPDSGFTVSGAQPATDSALIALGLRFNSGDGLGVFTRFDGAFGNGAKTYTGSTGVTFSW